MNRGSQRLADAAARQPHASMRPRFMNRGSTLLVKWDKPDDGASMRPRFMNRGSGRAGSRGDLEQRGNPPLEPLREVRVV